MNKNWVKKINAIAKQVKGGTDRITSQEWNFIVNSIAEQTNNNTTGVSESFYLIEKLEDFVKKLMNGEVSFNAIVLNGRNLEERIILIETTAENFKNEIKNYIDSENLLQDQEIVLKASIEYVDGEILVTNQNILTLSAYVDQIVDGTVVVKKAEQDKNGNDIVNTYETKADAASKKSELEGEILTLETNKVDKALTIIGLDLQDDIGLEEFKVKLGNATQSAAGLLSPEDKTHYDTLVALLETDDDNNIVDTIGEILAIFEDYPEGADLVTILEGKVNKVSGKGLSTEDYTTTEKSKLSGIEDGAEVNTVSPTDLESKYNFVDFFEGMGDFNIDTDCNDRTIYINVSNFGEGTYPSDYSTGGFLIQTREGINEYDVQALFSPVEGKMYTREVLEYDEEDNPLWGEWKDHYGGKVDKVLTAYDTLTSESMVGTEFLYVDADGTAKKMTLTELFEATNSSAGAFVPSGVYDELTVGYAKKSEDGVDIDGKFVSIDDEIDDIIDGTTVVKKAERDQLGNVINTTYETKADANLVRGRVTSLEEAIDDIEDGTTVVKKAEQDESGNNIKNTYATVTYVDGKISGVFRPSGNWNANTNTPTLANNQATNVGKVYRVTVAGTQFGLTFAVGDKLAFIESGVATKWDNVDDVTSVNGKVGTVVINADDISFDGSGTNYLTAKTEVKAAVKELDTRVKANADSVALKQDKLTAGENITIDPDTNVISASGGGDVSIWRYE